MEILSFLYNATEEHDSCEGQADDDSGQVQHGSQVKGSLCQHALASSERHQQRRRRGRLCFQVGQGQEPIQANARPPQAEYTRRVELSQRQGVESI